MKKIKFTIGCDPEVFVHNNSEHISVIGKIGGTKGNPIPLPHGGGIQEDNLAVEFNTPPASTRKEFVTNVVDAREDTKKLLSAPPLIPKIQS